MNQDTLVILGAAFVLVSLIAAVLAWISSVRWVAQHRKALDEAVRAKDEVIQARDGQLQDKEQNLEALKEEVGFLKELESLRFAERYMETKSGLEHRLHRLETKRKRWQDRLTDQQRRLDKLSLSSEQKSDETERLNSELAKARLDARTLEEALQAVSTVGDIPVADLESALARRRRRESQIAARLDQIGLEGEAKAAEIQRLKAEIERIGGEARRVEREIELTRSAGPILDHLLGVTGDMRQKMAQIETRLDRSLQASSDGQGRDPIADFLDAVAGQGYRPGRLLGAGADSEAEVEDDELDSPISSRGEAPEDRMAQDPQDVGRAHAASGSDGARAPDPPGDAHEAPALDPGDEAEARVVRDAVAAAALRSAPRTRPDPESSSSPS